GDGVLVAQGQAAVDALHQLAHRLGHRLAAPGAGVLHGGEFAGLVTARQSIRESFDIKEVLPQ
ncbi:hypothetical protein, partial [Gemmiger formicilis]|uniref:hypothetical protein n=1 Tax=Gemmiger formicilis TaxID=745368 RepID=UPI00195EEEF8